MPFFRSKAAVSTLAILGAMAASAATPAPATPPAHSRAAMAPKIPLSQLVDVNSAPKEALVKLPGITPALAEAIIAHRPYLSKAKLVTRKVIPLATFQMIRDHIMTMPPKK
jgi:DNA uptake protein ComE-like DNA-binding protein